MIREETVINEETVVWCLSVGVCVSVTSLFLVLVVLCYATPALQAMTAALLPERIHAIRT